MPRPPTTSWWPFPPQTREVQLDEERDFVGKKQAHRDPADPEDDHKGDYWDHVALDAEHRLVLAVVPGARSIGNAEAVVEEVRRRVAPDVPLLLTSDEYPAYETAIERAFGVPVPATGGPGRPRISPKRALPEAPVYATVRKHRRGHRVVAVDRRLILGTAHRLEAVLARSMASVGVNMSFLERQNGADRGRNARKVRKTYRFGKDWRVHEAMTYLTMYGYNYCWAVRTLRVKAEDGHWRRRSPAMAAGLTDHLWSWREWFTRPTVQPE